MNGHTSGNASVSTPKQGNWFLLLCQHSIEPSPESDDENEWELAFKILDVVCRDKESLGGEHTTGGNVAVFGGGMNAVFTSKRISGQSSLSFQGAINKSIANLERLLECSVQVRRYRDGLQTFPGFYEYNHICSLMPQPHRKMIGLIIAIGIKIKSTSAFPGISIG